MEMDSADALYGAVKSLMYAIWTEDNDTQNDVAHQMNKIAKPWMIQRWSESNLANGKPLVQIPKENAHHVDLEWTEDKQAKLMTLVERYTSRGASGAWRVHRWWLACFSLVLGDTKDRNNISGQWYEEWPLHTLVDSPIFWWLTETFLPMIFKESEEYPEPDDDVVSNEALLHEPASDKCSSPSVSPPQKAVLFCLLPGPVRYLKRWLTQFFVDHMDSFYMYAEMGNDEHTKMQLKFLDSSNPSVFITTPKVGGTGLNLTAANHAVITHKFWVLNEQCQAFAWVVRLGQNSVPHTQLLTTGPSGCDNRASDLHQLSGVAQMWVLYSLMSWLNITTMMIYQILECRLALLKRLTQHGYFVLSDGDDER